MKKIIYKVLLTLSLIVSLQGCVAVIGGAAVGAAGAATVLYDKRTMKEIMNDENLSYNISQALYANKNINQQCHIVVSTYRGTVLLVGQTPTDTLKQQASKIAKGIAGAKRLYNEITIEGPDSTLTRSSDTWITTKVKAQLLGTDNLKSGQFKVITENGTVYLMGQVSRSQAKLAENAVRRVDGVQKVVTAFDYMPDNG